MPLRFAAQRSVFLNRPDYIEEVLVGKHRNFVKGYAARLTRPLLGNGLLLSEGEFWKRQRRLAQPAFHHDRIKSYGRVMVEYAERALSRWQDGEVRDLHAEMMQLTLEIVAKVLFDTDVSSEVPNVGAALGAAQACIRARLDSLLVLPIMVPTPGNLRLRRAVRRLDSVIDGVVERRRAAGEDRGDLFSMLLHAQDDDGSAMSARQLRDELMTFFTAGHETTALALTWTWYLLAQHPEVESKLLNELQTVLGARAPNVAGQPKLPYTEMVIQESMRLYPPAWGIAREAVEDGEIGGYPIRAGTGIVISQWVTHRDPRYFDHPERFDPDRWASGASKALPKFAYFPFGGGQRTCIGASFAMLEATLLLATIARKFRFTLAPGQQVEPHALVTLRPKHGLKMELQRR